MGWGAGVRGFVASALEVERLRGQLGPQALLVIPGVRPVGVAVGDQKRIAAPVDVVRKGATHLVIGRPISRAEDPAGAFDSIALEIAGV
jgi:orotidine-5'-phosphate decarboxylase